MKKVVVLYSRKHAESIASAAVILNQNPGAVAVDVIDENLVSESLKGSGNVVYRMVDDIDERLLKGDKVHYTAKAKSKKKRRVIELCGEEVPYIINVIGDFHHNQDSEVFKAGVIADLSDLSNGLVLNKWGKLIEKNDLDIINSVKASGEVIVRYNNVVNSKKVSLKKVEKKSESKKETKLLKRQLRK